MMDGNYSLSDIKAVTDGENGFGGGAWWIIVLFLFMFRGGEGFGGSGATAATQHEILLGQQFETIGNKLNSIGDGLCQGFYSLNDSLKDCCCKTQLGLKDVIANNDGNTASVVSAMTAGFQRVIDNQNDIEMQHLRDAQMRDYIDKSLCGIVRYPMQMTYASSCNPFAGNPCGGCNGF